MSYESDLLKELDDILSSDLDVIEQYEIACKTIMQKALLQTVYAKYGARDERKQLVNAVEAEYNSNTKKLFVYFDTSKMSFYSIVYPELEVSKQIPYWLNFGHKGLFGEYLGQDFLTLAKNLIESSLDVKVEIVVPKIPWINLNKYKK